MKRIDLAANNIQLKVNIHTTEFYVIMGVFHSAELFIWIQNHQNFPFWLIYAFSTYGSGYVNMYVSIWNKSVFMPWFISLTLRWLSRNDLYVHHMWIYTFSKFLTLAVYLESQWNYHYRCKGYLMPRVPIIDAEMRHKTNISYTCTLSIYLLKMESHNFSVTPEVA